VALYGLGAAQFQAYDDRWAPAGYPRNVGWGGCHRP
jgi:hypothetical protein